MLGKLLKYEIKATNKIFLILYATNIFMALVVKGLSLFDKHVMAPTSLPTNDIPTSTEQLIGIVFGIFLTLANVVYVVAIVAMFACVIIVAISRFYTNLMTHQGYLMFTLPVKVKHHIWTKLICSIMWISASVVVSMISLSIVYNDILIKVFNIFKGMFTEDFNVLSIILMVILALVVYIMFNLNIFCSISIGQLSSKNKPLFSVLAYFGIYVVQQIIYYIVLIVGVVFAQLVDIERFAESINTAYIGNGFLVVIIVWEIILSCIFFFISNKILSTKLNLE